MSPMLVVANIVGYIGLFLIWFQVVFGSRHIFKYLTNDTVLINRWHKQIGIYGMLFFFAHPLLSMMSRLEDFSWIFVPDFSTGTSTYISLGKIAFILLIIIWITSAIIREKIKWRPWKYIHLLSYPVIILAFIHVTYIGTFYHSYIGIRIIWMTMFLMVVFSIILRLCAWGGLLKNKAVITNLEIFNETILFITLKPKTTIYPSIGQHVYIQSGPWKSEHPFTVMENVQDRGEIVLGIRKLGGLWDELMAKKVGDSILLDGPYGVFTKEAQNTDPKVIISGGIGVTPFIDLVKNYGSNAIYINCNRTLEDVVRRDVIKSQVFTYVDIVDSYSGEKNDAIKVGRISKEIIKDIVGEKVLSMPYFICGSPMFITIVRGILMELGVKKEKIYFEELGF